MHEISIQKTVDFLGTNIKQTVIEMKVLLSQNTKPEKP
jgi:hypothetical protein